MIDVFREYGWVVQKVALAFRKLDNTPRSRLYTDNGTEVYKQQLKAVLSAKM